MNDHNPEGEPLSPEFLARLKRLDDAAKLRLPDSVPVAPLVTYYPNVVRGVSNREVHYDRALRVRLWREATVDHEWDAAPPIGHLLDAPPLELIGATQYKWPGGGSSDNQPFQYVEGEYMLQDEYDEMLRDPTGFALKRLWPRVAAALAPAAALASAPCRRRSISPIPEGWPVSLVACSRIRN
jgi:hypothetical protein